MIYRTSALLLVLLSVACSPAPEDGATLREKYAVTPEKWPLPTLDEGVSLKELGSLPEVKFPSDNPHSRAKAELGEMLFFDPRLSESKTVACASCHDPELGWSDGRMRSFGHERRRGNRNAMSILNTAYYHSLFWDGRASTLEEQASFPIADTLEMNMPLPIMVENIAQIEGYTIKFEQAFGDDSVTLERIQKAIAIYERTVISRPSDFDRFIKGDKSALSDQEILGLHIFRTKGRCLNCHNGPLFSDNKFHNLGQSHLGRPTQDLGQFLVTGDTADVGKFKTPSLRDVAFTGPYLHHGSIAELAEVIDMYERGMPQMIPKKFANHPLYPEKSPHLQPLTLTYEEKEALLLFLGAISSRPRRVSAPVLP